MFYVEYMFYVLCGLLGIFENYGAYQCWVWTTSSRVKLFKEMLEMCDMINYPERPKPGKNCDLEASQIKNSECAEKKVNGSDIPFHKPMGDFWQRKIVLSVNCGSYSTGNRGRYPLCRWTWQDFEEHIHTRAVDTSPQEGLLWPSCTSKVKDNGRCQQNCVSENITRESDSVQGATRSGI